MQHNDILNIFEFSDNNRIYDSSIIRNNQKLLNLFNSSMIILPASLFKNIEEDGGKIRLHTNDQFKSFNIGLIKVSNQTLDLFHQRYL